MIKNFDSIYLDFDGTITKRDTVGTFLQRFAEPKWIEVEKEWADGKINSKECMQRQLDLVSNVTEPILLSFLDTVEIQDGFIEFYKVMKNLGKKVTILSDGFDFFISYILNRNNIFDIDFYSNKLNIYKENEFLKFKLEFPNENKNCSLSLGNCKCAKVHKNEKFIYSGDGLSDRCIASKSNLLFAKSSLKNHCLKNNIPFVEFGDFFDILNYLVKKGENIDAGFKAKTGAKDTFRG